MNNKFILLLCTVFLLAISSFAKTTTLQILTTTDTHGTFYPYNYETNQADYSGSLAQIATEVKKLKTDYPQNTILVDNGDVIQGNAQTLFLDTKENPMIAAMNHMGYDLINLGNHEFNYGIPTLKHVMSQFNAADGQANSVLCGNIYDKNGKHLFAPYKIVETKDGIKVGFIGMVSPNIKRWDSENLEGYKITNPVTETLKIVKEIRDKVDVLIAINHMGEEIEYGEPGSGVMEIAEKCPELDLIISGHAHAGIPDDYYYKGKIYSGIDATEKIREKGILIIEAGCRGQLLGQILINLTKENDRFIIKNKANNISSKTIPMEFKKNGNKEYIQPDPETMAVLKPFHEEALKDANKVIGKLVGTEPLAPKNIIKGIAQRELQPNAMSQLINDVQLYYAPKMLKGDNVKVSAAALLRIDGNINPGDIRKSDIALIYKYPNTLYVLEITGAQLKKFMEFSAGFFNQYKPGDLTISFNPDFRFYLFCNFAGVKYDIDISKPVGSRIVNLTWLDETPVKPDDKFLMTTNNYMSNSHLTKAGSVFKKGDSMPTIIAKSDNISDMGNMQNLINKYIVDVKHGTIKVEYIDNWKIIGNDWNKKQHEEAVKLINSGKLTVKNKYDRAQNSQSVTFSNVQKALEKQ